MYSKIGMRLIVAFFSSRLSPFVIAYRAVLLPRDSRFNHPAVRIAVFAVLFRVGSAILAFVINVVFPMYQHEQFAMFDRTSPFWDPFTRYDWRSYRHREKWI